MIKIDLCIEKKGEIEKIFLEDLLGDDNDGKVNGKLTKILDDNNNRKFLQEKCKGLYNYFYDENEDLKIEEVKDLLLADRNKMEELINEFGSYNCNDSNDRDLSKKLLSNIFRYDNFSNRKVAYEMLHKMGVTVCPYCNRSYIMVLKRSKIRPQFDHYFPKSKYPYLALSLYNLIPSCSICNMSKSDMDTMETPVLYPYKEEFGEEIAFTVDIEGKDEFVKYMRGASDEIEVFINNPNHILEEQVNNQNNRLHITELYNEHKDYIRDIFRNYHINTDKRVKELLDEFPDIFSAEEEIRSIMFMNDIRKENWGKRPLAKLTYDIYTELKKLSDTK